MRAEVLGSQGTRQLTRSEGSTVEIEGVAAVRRGESGGAWAVINGVVNVRERRPSRRGIVREKMERVRLWL